MSSRKDESKRLEGPRRPLTGLPIYPHNFGSSTESRGKESLCKHRSRGPKERMGVRCRSNRTDVDPSDREVNKKVCTDRSV